MKNKLLLLVLIFSLSFNAAVLGALAYHFWLGRPAVLPGPGWPAGDSSLDRDLDLSPQQAETVVGLRDDMEKRTYPICTKIHTKRQELFELLQTEQPDSAAISEKVDEINALQRQMQSTVVDYMLREKEVLNEEQRQVFFGRIGGRLCPGGGAGGMGPLYGPCRKDRGRGRCGR